MSALGAWSPLYPAHAIEQVNAKVIFAQSVTDIPWKRIQECAREQSRKLQLVTERPIQHVDVVMTGDLQGSMGAPKDVGLEFLRLESPNFYSDKLTVQRDSISFENWRYTRWHAFEKKIKENLGVILDLYMLSVPILGIQVEYIDRFNSTDPSDNPDCSVVIKHPSEFVAEGAFRETETWHCHTGFFASPDETTKRLTNINVDVADVSQKNDHGITRTIRTIRIRTHLTDFFNQSGYKEIPDEEISPEFVGKRVNDLHVQLKGMLHKVITREAAEAISLAGDDNA